MLHESDWHILFKKILQAMDVYQKVDVLKKYKGLRILIYDSYSQMKVRKLPHPSFYFHPTKTIFTNLEDLERVGLSIFKHEVTHYLLHVFYPQLGKKLRETICVGIDASI